jgi:hypothetical protein
VAAAATHGSRSLKLQSKGAWHRKCIRQKLQSAPEQALYSLGMTFDAEACYSCLAKMVCELLLPKPADAFGQHPLLLVYACVTCTASGRCQGCYRMEHGRNQKNCTNWPRYAELQLHTTYCQQGPLTYYRCFERRQTSTTGRSCRPSYPSCLCSSSCRHCSARCGCLCSQQPQQPQHLQT